MDEAWVLLFLWTSPHIANFVQSSKAIYRSTRQAANPCALRMSNDNWELTDVGRRNLEDLEGKWKRVCVLGGSRGESLPCQSIVPHDSWFPSFVPWHRSRPRSCEGAFKHGGQRCCLGEFIAWFRKIANTCHIMLVPLTWATSHAGEERRQQGRAGAHARSQGKVYHAKYLLFTLVLKNTSRLLTTEKLNEKCPDKDIFRRLMTWFSHRLLLVTHLRRRTWSVPLMVRNTIPGSQDAARQQHEKAPRDFIQLANHTHASTKSRGVKLFRVKDGVCTQFNLVEKLVSVQSSRFWVCQAHKLHSCMILQAIVTTSSSRANACKNVWVQQMTSSFSHVVGPWHMRRRLPKN